MLLDVKNVKKTFGRGLNATTALNGISFTVDKGEFVAIMGESGSGKSTLLNLIATFDKVSEGNITINNQDIRKLRNISKLRISVVITLALFFKISMSYQL